MIGIVGIRNAILEANLDDKIVGMRLSDAVRIEMGHGWYDRLVRELKESFEGRAELVIEYDPLRCETVFGFRVKDLPKVEG